MRTIIVALTAKAEQYMQDTHMIREPFTVYPFLTSLKEKRATGRLPDDFDLVRGKDFLEYGLLEKEEEG